MKALFKGLGLLLLFTAKTLFTVRSECGDVNETDDIRRVTRAPDDRAAVGMADQQGRATLRCRELTCAVDIVS
jgi:hypothetical protein